MIQLKSEKTGKDVRPIIEDGRAYSKESSAPVRTPMDSPEDATTASSLKSDMKAAHDNNAALPERLEQSRHSRNVSTGAAASLVPSDPPVNDGSHTMQPSSSRPMTAQINGTGRYNVPSDQLMNMIEAKLEPLNRMQNQISMNGAGVEHNAREIRAIGEAVAMMQAEMRRMADTIEALRRDLYSRPPAGPRLPRGEIPDETLEIFSSQLQGAIRKANEVDEVKVQLELLKRKVGRSSTVESSPTTGHPYSAQQQTPIHSTPLSQHAMPPVVPHLGMPRPPPQPHHPAYVQPYTPEIPPRPIESEHPSSGAGSGWTSVNTNAKRGYPNGIDAHSEAGDTPLGSPKRQKLAPIEPPHAPGTLPSQPMQYDRMETDEPIHPPRLQSHESYPDSTTSSNFHPDPNTQQADPDDSWRPESQRVISNPVPDIHRSPRGRPRGRGGRPRKSLPVESHTLVTPEWEKDTWTGPPIGQEGFYPVGAPVPKRGGIVRRGSGGATSANRIAIPPPPPSQVGTISVVDQYAHTKKTRTKPIRNADGILIRKDGRPDMRSQSSAANLRKVHARKEEEKRLEASAAKATVTTESSPMTPASHDTDGNANVRERGEGDGEEEQPPNTQERTEKILQKMFPGGIDEQKGRLATPENYFPGGKGTDETVGEAAEGGREDGVKEGTPKEGTTEATTEAAAA